MLESNSAFQMRNPPLPFTQSLAMRPGRRSIRSFSMRWAFSCYSMRQAFAACLALSLVRLLPPVSSSMPFSIH
jgi:hypothetical protein